MEIIRRIKMTSSFNHLNENDFVFRQVTDLDGNTSVICTDEPQQVVDLVKDWCGDDLASIVESMIDNPINHDTMNHNLKKKLSIATKTNKYQKKRIKFLEDILTRKGITFK